MKIVRLERSEYLESLSKRNKKKYRFFFSCYFEYILLEDFFCKQRIIGSYAYVRLERQESRESKNQPSNIEVVRVRELKNS